jgi:hypothetical protein
MMAKILLGQRVYAGRARGKDLNRAARSATLERLPFYPGGNA